MITWILFATPFVLLMLSLAAFFRLAPQVGGNPAGGRLRRLQASPNFREGKFQNAEPLHMRMGPARIVKVIRDSTKKGVEREPRQAIPTLAFDQERWASISAGDTALCWFGHSSLLLKIEGKTLLFDPVFGARASMFSFAGPRHFPYTHHPRVSELPGIDILVLTHDHYDHLDYPTVSQLRDKVGQVYTSLGVGAHLERWGFDAQRIIELDWWEEANPDGRLLLACTPSRHFSGRGLTNRFSTLWSSWVIAGRRHRIFFGSDSGYHAGFLQIGDQYGPFDLTLLECGAYSRHWPDVHNTPEEAVQAHLELKGRLLMPIHWAKFNLAQHAWTEPVERLKSRAQQEAVPLMTPPIGEIVILGDELPQRDWWNYLENRD